MLVFLIPLKSSQVSSSWETVSELLERTLKSACSQTSPNFRVVVVCHEQPHIQFSHAQIKYISVDFPAPTVHSVHEFDKDKARKIWTGLQAIDLNIDSSHVMFVDADDCVSNRLAKFVDNHPQSNGWYFSRGYEYPEGSSTIFYRRRNFHQKSGTSHIVRYSLLKQFLQMDINNVDMNFLFHKDIVSLMKVRGKSLEELPFAGAAYVTENGENIWMQRKFFLQKKLTYEQAIRFYGGMAYKLFVRKPLTQSIRDEFGIYDLA